MMKYADMYEACIYDAMMHACVMHVKNVGRTDGELNTRSRINLENKTKRQIDKKAERSEDEKKLGQIIIFQQDLELVS